MRTVLLLLFTALLGLGAAELEQITTTDGRRLIGYYDEAAGTVTIEGPPRAVLRLTAAQIAAREPFLRATPIDPIKRDEAALVQLEAERASAIAEAGRLRKFAATRSGKDAEVALAQARERDDQAATIAGKIAVISARLETTRPPPAAKEPTAVHLVPSDVRLETARQAAGKGLAEAFELRDRAAIVEFAALLDLLKAMDLEPKAVPELGADPRKSEIEQQDLIAAENRKRIELKARLEEAPTVVTTAAKEHWSRVVLRLLELPNESEARRVEQEEEARRAKEQRDKKRIKAR